MSANPIGVGFIGLDSEGLFHLERMLLRPEFRCVAGWVESGDVATLTHGRLSQASQSPAEIIRHPDIDLIWIGPKLPVDLTTEALDAGQHVVHGLPVDLSPQVWRQWSPFGSLLHVAALHRWDGEFRTVKASLSEPGLGPLVNVRRLSRQYVPVEDHRSHHPTVAATRDTFDSKGALAVRRAWFEMLDQLLVLVAEPVASVTAWPSDPTSKKGVTRQSVRITFTSGCEAFLELDRSSFAPLETGWILDGMSAGLAGGRRYRATADYELVDVPVEELPTDQNAFYDALIASTRHGDEFPVTMDSIARVLELLDMIDAAISRGAPVGST